MRESRGNDCCTRQRRCGFDRFCQHGCELTGGKVHGYDCVATGWWITGRDHRCRTSRIQRSVAAYETRDAADARAKQLSARGYAVRVMGDRKPFRVRVGRYPTRERAGDAVRQMARVNVRGVIVEAEPR